VPRRPRGWTSRGLHAKVAALRAGPECPEQDPEQDKASGAAEIDVVRFEHIGKRYRTGGQILSDVSFELAPGGFYFLTGGSGAGKTTLLKMIYLAELPSRGRMVLFDSDAASLDRAARAALRRRIGIVFQDFRLLDTLSVHENVALPLRIAGVAERQIRDNVRELLAWVGIAHRSAASAAALSGGERQRVAIARAIVGRPQLLIADEPAGNVDDEAALLLVRVFERINHLGTTVLIATHDVALSRQFEYPRFHLDRGQLSVASDLPA
jgi:cell division transport system ATP-binding protein